MSGCCGVNPIHKHSTDAELAESRWVELAVFGMGCGSCANRVHNSLISLPGVYKVMVDYPSGLAQVVFNPDKTSISDIFLSVVQAGGDGKHKYSAHLIPQETAH